MARVYGPPGPSTTRTVTAPVPCTRNATRPRHAARAARGRLAVRARNLVAQGQDRPLGRLPARPGPAEAVAGVAFLQARPASARRAPAGRRSAHSRRQQPTPRSPSGRSTPRWSAWPRWRVQDRGRHVSRRSSALFGCATPPEQEFLVALILGELRQGALAGVMAEAIAQAAAVPSADVRRAAMLGGDLGAVARGRARRGRRRPAPVPARGRPARRPDARATAADVEAALARARHRPRSNGSSTARASRSTAAAARSASSRAASTT